MLVTSLTTESSESPCQLTDLNLTEDLTANDNITKMVVIEFGQTLIRASESVHSTNRMITIHDIFGAN